MTCNKVDNIKKKTLNKLHVHLRKLGGKWKMENYS
jgi:hypothetical protein